MNELFLLLTSLVWFLTPAQWLPQSSGTTASLRGVSAVDSRVAWASGNKGTVRKTTDGGATWQAITVPGAESLDFRDVEAFDANTASLLSIGEGEKSKIFKTTDGGRNWKLQFTNQHPRAFFDAIAFWDVNNGIALSDPVDGRFLIIKTTDGGSTWKEIENSPPALPGEAAFAASGTCITVQGRSNAWIGTGGGAARVFRSTDGGTTWQAATTPIQSGQPSSGIFSIAFKDPMNGVIVGGDYTKETESRSNAATTNDGGRTWKPVDGKIPGGFRSGVSYLTGSPSPIIIAVGPNGADYSLDNGASWLSLESVGYHAVDFALSGAGWAVGAEGKIGKYKKN